MKILWLPPCHSTFCAIQEAQREEGAEAQYQIRRPRMEQVKLRCVGGPCGASACCNSHSINSSSKLEFVFVLVGVGRQAASCGSRNAGDLYYHWYLYPVTYLTYWVRNSNPVTSGISCRSIQGFSPPFSLPRWRPWSPLAEYADRRLGVDRVAHRSEPRSDGSAIEFGIPILAHEHRTRLQVSMKVEEQLALLLSKMDKQSKTISGVDRRINDVFTAVEDLRAVKADFECWCPRVDKQVTDLHDCVSDLRQQLDALQSPSTPTAPQHLESGLKSGKVLTSVHLGASGSKPTPGPLGHGDEHFHRSDGSRCVYTHEPPPVTGTKPNPHPHTAGFDFSHGGSCCAYSHLGPAMPPNRLS